jgi:hypothetical protein
MLFSPRVISVLMCCDYIKALCVPKKQKHENKNIKIIKTMLYVPRKFLVCVDMSH